MRINSFSLSIPISIVQFWEQRIKAEKYHSIPRWKEKKRKSFELLYNFFTIKIDTIDYSNFPVNDSILLYVIWFVMID